MGFNELALATVFNCTIEIIALWAWHYEEFYNAITPSKEQVENFKKRIEESKNKRRVAKRTRLNNSKHERIANSMRARLNAAIKKHVDLKKGFSDLGYGKEELCAHLESMFADGMTWENYGLWHIDHIRPCASFDLTNTDDFNECWALSNLQPLWAEDNLRKSAKYERA